MRRLESLHATRTTPCPLAISVALLAWHAGASAAGPLPEGGKFVAGTGTISSGANRVDITQSSTRGVIDWNAFSIGSGNAVNIDNGSGATLSRVAGTSRSQIDGSLTATGSLYLINRQGVVIGTTGIVTTGGRFVASTLDVGNDEFMAGGALSLIGSGTGTVVNLGKISSTGGDVFLISRALAENDGTISAPAGSAELAAGDMVLIHDSTSLPQTFVQSAHAGDAVNKGNIRAAQIALQAADGNVYALAGNATALRATGTAVRDGHVWLVAPRGTAHVHSPIYATDTVDTTGNVIHLDDHTDIHAAQWNLNAPVFNVGPVTTAILLRQLNQGTSVALDATQGDIVLEQTLRWTGDASLTANAYRSVTIGPIATLGNAGTGNLTLRADASGIDNGGSVTNRGTIDWTRSTGVVSVLRDINGTYAPGTIRTNSAWSAAPFSGLETQFTAYKLVNTATDLAAVSNDLSGNYALGKSIALTGTFAGIGVATQSAFKGQFDGMGYSIDGLGMSDTASSSQSEYVGLFGIVGASGIVRNLSVSGYVYTDIGTRLGMLAGLNQGTLVNVHTAGNVTDSNAFFGSFMGGLAARNEGTIERSSSTVDLDGQAGLGGLVAQNTGTINQSFATGYAVAGSHGSGIGGLVETNSGTITQSYATGDTALDLGDNGGLVADNSGTVRESFSTGNVTLFGPNQIAGFIGANGGPISDNFWNTETSGKTIGVNGTGAAGVTGLTTAQMSVASNFGPQWNFGPGGTWVIPAGGTHPVLRWQLNAQ